jgi:hypothetical protein
MSPRDEPPKDLASQRYREFFEAFARSGRPTYQMSGRDESAFLWRQRHRDRVAARNASKTWHYEPMPVPSARVTPPEPEPREEPPEPEEEGVAPPPPPKRKGRFQTLEL